MAAVYTTQYQPISNAETCSNAALTVRSVRDMVDSLNNAKRHAMVDKVLSHISPLGTQSSNLGSTAERVVLVFSPRVVPKGYTAIRFLAGHARQNGAGQTTWKLYCMPQKYRGPVGILSGMIPSGSTTGTIIGASADYNIATNTVDIVRSAGDECWLLLTAQNNVASSYSKIWTLDAWPVYS